MESMLVQTLKDLAQYCDPAADAENVREILRLRRELSEGLALKDDEQLKYIDELTTEVHEAEESAKSRDAPLCELQSRTEKLGQEIDAATRCRDSLVRDRSKLREEIVQLEQVIGSIRTNRQRLDTSGGTESVAKAKTQLSFYSMVSNVKWDYSSPAVKGVLSSPKTTAEFEFPEPTFATVNQLWDMIQSSS